MLLLLSLLTAVPTGTPPAFFKCDPAGRQLALDVSRSQIRWRGTKFWGLGKHEGAVRFKAGGFCVKDGAVLNAWFEVDMTTIDVTDIPANDPVPRKRLRDHLLGPDFFHVAEHPVARFLVRNVTEEKARLFQVRGDLTIRGRTHPVTFYARVWSVTDAAVRAEARLEVERHKYGVSYRGSTIKDDLVDDTFWLDLSIEARGPWLTPLLKGII